MSPQYHAEEFMPLQCPRPMAVSSRVTQKVESNLTLIPIRVIQSNNVMLGLGGLDWVWSAWQRTLVRPGARGTALPFSEYNPQMEASIVVTGCALFENSVLIRSSTDSERKNASTVEKHKENVHASTTR